jgi:hypothetical protein
VALKGPNNGFRVKNVRLGFRGFVASGGPPFLGDRPTGHGTLCCHRHIGVPMATPVRSPRKRNSEHFEDGAVGCLFKFHRWTAFGQTAFARLNNLQCCLGVNSYKLLRRMFRYL